VLALGGLDRWSFGIHVAVVEMRMRIRLACIGSRKGDGLLWVDEGGEYAQHLQLACQLCSVCFLDNQGCDP
jgi:hypothetical protein